MTKPFPSLTPVSVCEMKNLLLSKKDDPPDEAQYSLEPPP